MLRAKVLIEDDAEFDLSGDLLSGSLTEDVLTSDQLDAIDQFFSWTEDKQAPQANPASSSVAAPIQAQAQALEPAHQPEATTFAIPEPEVELVSKPAPPAKPTSAVSLWELIDKNQYAQIAHLLRSKDPAIAQQLNQKRNNQTLLYFAVNHGQQELFCELMLAGADFCIKNEAECYPVYRPNRDKYFALWLWDNRAKIKNAERTILAIATVLAHAFTDDLKIYHQDLLFLLNICAKKDEKAFTAFVNRQLVGKARTFIEILACEEHEYIELVKLILDRLNPATGRQKNILEYCIKSMRKHNHQESLKYLAVCQNYAFKSFFPAFEVQIAPATQVPQSPLEQCGELVGEWNRHLQLRFRLQDMYDEHQKSSDILLKKIVELQAQLTHHITALEKNRVDSRRVLGDIDILKGKISTIHDKISGFPSEVRRNVYQRRDATTGVMLLYMAPPTNNNNITGAKRPLESDPNNVAGPSHRGNGPR
jgi:hypothetical protein